MHNAMQKNERKKTVLLVHVYIQLTIHKQRTFALIATCSVSFRVYCCLYHVRCALIYTHTHTHIVHFRAGQFAIFCIRFSPFSFCFVLFAIWFCAYFAHNVRTTNTIRITYTLENSCQVALFSLELSLSEIRSISFRLIGPFFPFLNRNHWNCRIGKERIFTAIMNEWCDRARIGPERKTTNGNDLTANWCQYVGQYVK